MKKFHDATEYLIELKVTNPRRLKEGAVLKVVGISQVNPKLKRVEVTVEDQPAQSIVVWKGPKDVDWSTIADMIAEGFLEGIGIPENTNWELK